MKKLFVVATLALSAFVISACSSVNPVPAAPEATEEVELNLASLGPSVVTYQDNDYIVRYYTQADQYLVDYRAGFNFVEPWTWDESLPDDQRNNQCKAHYPQGLPQLNRFVNTKEYQNRGNYCSVKVLNGKPLISALPGSFTTPSQGERTADTKVITITFRRGTYVPPSTTPAS